MAGFPAALCRYIATQKSGGPQHFPSLDSAPRGRFVYTRERAMTDQHYALFETPIGICGIEWGPRGINGLQLPMGSDEKTRARIRRRRGDIAEAAPTDEVQRAIDRIVKLLAGERDDLMDIALDLDGVPEVNRGFYDIARTIPPGQTMTYGDIATRLGGVGLL